MSEKAISQPQDALRPRTISGKKLTIGLMVTLVDVCFVVGWVSLAYGDFAKAKRDAERAWNEASELLSLRYKAADKVIATAVDAQSIDKQFGEKWRSTRSVFDGVFVPDGKVRVAVELEEMLREVRAGKSFEAGALDSVKPSEELRTRVENYNHAAGVQADVMAEPGLRVLRSVLILRDPIQLQLAE